MFITEKGKAEVKTDSFKERLNLLLFKLHCQGESQRDIRGTMATAVAMTLCIDLNNEVSVADGELERFLVKHAATIDEVLQGAVQYAQRMAGAELASYNPTMRYSTSVH